jgi:hypothetical protein
VIVQSLSNLQLMAGAPTLTMVSGAAWDGGASSQESTANRTPMRDDNFFA